MKYGRALEEGTCADGHAIHSGDDGEVALRSANGQLRGSSVLTLRRSATTHTREKPGDGFASVLMMSVSCSATAALLLLRIGNDHTPRAPLMIGSFFFFRKGRSF